MWLRLSSHSQSQTLLQYFFVRHSCTGFHKRADIPKLVRWHLSYVFTLLPSPPFIRVRSALKLDSWYVILVSWHVAGSLKCGRHADWQEMYKQVVYWVAGASQRRCRNLCRSPRRLDLNETHRAPVIPELWLKQEEKGRASTTIERLQSEHYWSALFHNLNSRKVLFVFFSCHLWECMFYTGRKLEV